MNGGVLGVDLTEGTVDGVVKLATESFIVQLGLCLRLWDLLDLTWFSD